MLNLFGWQIIIIKSTKCVQDTLLQFVGCNMQINKY